ncbi:aldo/keto reductase [Levilactobacillus zymae]|uniref:Aldo/keto reductase n=1 Tax=Levilactobacillus zymae TaxID=267363 RepID=A0ABQ0WW81_9LACO|nr:aldo/keto reductase [Levilactobacillus zymae]KRL08695.1 oxidoreductase [Levilactobacillus zymae DSM 19395]QFR61534.1 aldo/keto reductase [Levilactobacillus zymae]GEO72095.1 aldo/keto reductase [Levilactobacillus zymae]
MKQLNLGGTDWQASAVALGIMRMADLSVADAAKALEAAHDAGITYIDSADIYGDGASEKKFKEALAASNLSRDDFYIQSKGGIVLDPARSHDGLVFGKRYDFSKQHLLDAVDGILSRMGVDYLDAFLLHRPDPLMEPEEVADAFNTLQREGKVRHFGVSNFNVQQYLLVQDAVDQKLMFNQLQFGPAHTGMIDAGMHVNMEDKWAVDHDGGMLEFARRHHVTIQAWSPFQYGLFAGMIINDPKYQKLNDELQKLADKYGVSKNGIVIAWILRHPANIQVLLGTMNPAHIADSAAGADVTLTKQEWYNVYFAAGNTLP